jgi:MFS transporter, ACS family, tartrate transporter
MIDSPAELRVETLRRVWLRLLPFLFLLYVVAYLDRINVGFAALQMKTALGISDAVYGFGAGVFFLGYVTFEIPSNLIMERVGARRWIARIMITWGLISSCMMFVRSPLSFYALRFLLGVAEAGFFPGIILYLTYWFPNSARARAVAGFMMAGPISAVIGAPLSGLLLDLHGWHGLQGWQWLFVLEGIPAIILGFVVLAYLDDRPAKARWLSEPERASLEDWIAAERGTTAAGHRSFGEAAVNPRVWLLGLLYLALNICSYGLSLWLPQVIKSIFGSSNRVVGMIVAAPYLAASIAMVLAGRHSDKSGERAWHVAIGGFAAAIALVGAAYANSGVSATIAFAVAIVSKNTMLGPFWAIPTRWLSGAAAAGGIALINSIGNTGGFLGPYLIGLLRTYTGDFRAGVLVLAFAMAVSGAIALMFQERMPATQRGEP